MAVTKELVDPDRFPVWDLGRVRELYFSRWGEVEGGLRWHLGHQLVIGDSLLEHPSAGRGVFLALSRRQEKVSPGDLLGLVPGIIYDTYNAY